MSITTVVNCKVAHIRPHYQNLEQWCQDPNNAYIGRVVFINGVRYPANDSLFANPFKIPKGVTDRSQCLTQYYQYIHNRLSTEPELFNQLLQLRGKNLGCWCALYDKFGNRTNPDQCHGDILVKILESYPL